MQYSRNTPSSFGLPYLWHPVETAAAKNSALLPPKTGGTSLDVLPANTIIPYLDCTAEETIALCPIHPHLLNASSNQRYYQIPTGSFTQREGVLYYPAHINAQGESIESAFQRMDMTDFGRYGSFPKPSSDEIAPLVLIRGYTRAGELQPLSVRYHSIINASDNPALSNTPSRAR